MRMPMENNFIISILPQQFITMAISTDFNTLLNLVQQKVNLDEKYHDELIVAYSYYETLSQSERSRILTELNNIKIDDILTYVYMRNVDLFSQIEQYTESNNSIILYLQNQLQRIKCAIVVFESMLTKK